jgi:hypothetical protein
MWPAAALVGVGAVLAANSFTGVKNLDGVRARDGKTYNVQNLPDKQEAADMMSEIVDRLKKLITKYRDDPASSADPRTKNLIDRFNPENICENEITANSTSYSENKGEKIVVCLRDKEPPHRFVEINTVMFVMLHEMSHLMTTTTGHTPEFWTNFKKILQDAVSVGIYTPTNYSRSPVRYCGMSISDSPI